MGTLKAGINYLIQSHISIILLTIGFIWVSSSTDSYDFDAISAYSAHVIPAVSFLLFGCFFLGFAFKAGFIPFHTWLPYAHPAAPAHVSAIMSGVIIKLGIFGILRMLLLIDRNQLMIGYVILVVSFVTGVYGVMLAIIQHNLKKLLAYHSIENIGIIGMGIGLGSIGLGLDKPVLTFAGFSGALLHTLNHSLFKSLLFYSAGSVHQVTHTMNIEKLGGLIKQMPQTATLFLIASLAITGLPPLNGFVSEFLS
jgi:formate hydrogenlyase subunit 3/multisubunit Na+/H+ antiporter MnhD subunit